MSYLSENHASIMAKACECYYVFVAVVPGDTLIENGPGQMHHDFRENKTIGERHKLLTGCHLSFRSVEVGATRIQVELKIQKFFIDLDNTLHLISEVFPVH